MQIAGLEGVAADSHVGRSSGPKYVWVDQSECEVAGPARTTSVSRAWRRSAGWLADILRAKKAATADTARWKLLFYEHPLPDLGYATPEQIWSMELFNAWRSNVTEENTFTPAWVKTFKAIAEKQADKEEEAARIAATVKFAAWLQEGPANGLRRQHRFSRTADGWCETMLVGEDGSEVNERDDLDGLSEQQLASVKGCGKEACLSPAEAQQEANRAAKDWGGHWGCELKDQEELQWPVDMGGFRPTPAPCRLGT